MKKTSKSPENAEVTPSKKKLKQARLPFMVVSDVSPKTDTLQSRKRKLSVPEAEPVTKVGKLSKDDTINEESVLISDEDSKGVPSPKKQDQTNNPYMKLVDTARKKKLEKSKVQKKSKTRSSKKQTNNGSKKQISKDDDQKSECNDVEMVEVDVIIHEEGDKDITSDVNKLKNGDLNAQSDGNQPDNKSTPDLKMVTSEEQSEASSMIPNSKEKSTENIEAHTEKLSETIDLEDSNNSSDVLMSQCKNTTIELNKQSEVSKNPKETNSKRKGLKPTRTPVTLKFSARNKTNGVNSKTVNKSTATDEKDSKKEQTVKTEESPNINPKKTKTDNSSQIIELENSSDEDESEDTSINANTKDSPQKSSEESTKSYSEEIASTPKRSTRIKAKEEALDISTTSDNESMISVPSTPTNKSGSENADKSMNESIKSANLTPKQLQKRLESVKRKEEREKERLERERKRQQEKEEKTRERLEKEQQKKREREEKEEAKKKEREEKEEQRKKEREEKEKQKELEKKAKEFKEEQKRKEREDKEEQRRKEKEAREEEKRKRQEALELEKQEQELKKKKAATAFVNFFVPKQKVDREPSVAPVSKNSALSSFTIKVDMRLAPTTRVDLSEERREALEKFLEGTNPEECLYLKSLKDGSAKPLSSGKTWPLDDKDDDVMIVEDELPPIDGGGEVITCESAPREKLRPKLLSFHENRRPPYWGTWRKKSMCITPRKPFGQEKQLDYEVDSDDDWEDEQDGESLDGSAGGSDDEGVDDYEVDHEVFVPHGYLSDEEATMDEDDVLSLSPETQKARLKHLEDEFESELKKPTEKLKPRLYGLLWETSDGGKPDKCVDALWNYFEKFAMIMNDPTFFLQPVVETDDSAKKEKKIKKKKILAEVNDLSPNSEKKKKKTENKEPKKPKQETKKTVPNQPGINTFLTKVKTT